MTLFASFISLGSGLSVGLSGLAAGFAIGIVGDAGVRGTAQQPRLFVGMVLILIFAEVLGLYGLIVAYVVAFILIVDWNTHLYRFFHRQSLVLNAKAATGTCGDY